MNFTYFLLCILLLSIFITCFLFADAQDRKWDFHLRESIILAHSINQHGKILNEDKFPLPSPDAPPFLLLVHQKSVSLVHCLQEIAQIEGVNQTTLIISHDGIFPEVWNIVQKIDFMRVKQIVHPYSPWLQSNLHVFPGDDPLFKATGPHVLPHGHDQYDHNRDPKYVSLKHHWWWAFNAVFQGRVGLPPPRAVMYLEDDWVLSKDYYAAATSLLRWREGHCESCLTLNMGTHRKSNQFNPSLHEVAIGDFDNLGLIFMRDTWESTIAKSETFCRFDDYNWDWSLRAVFSQQKRGGKLAASLSTARLKHIGRCGLHGFDKTLLNDKLCNFLEDHNHFAHSAMFKATADPEVSVPKNDEWSVKHEMVAFTSGKGNGGWGAKEDHEHCIAVANGKIFELFNEKSASN